MPDTITPNYSLVKPEVMGSVDTWGGKLNTNFDILDTEVKENETTGANSLKKAHDDVLERTAKGFLFYDTTLGMTHDQGADCIMSNKSVRALLNLALPIGTVIMWSGQAYQVPWGWALCNGADPPAGQPRTPNLLDRMIVCSGASWATGAAGGSAALVHSARVSGTALDANTLPWHYHTISQGSHKHNVPWNKVSSGYGAYPTSYGGAGYAGDLAQYDSNGLDSSVAGTGVGNTEAAGASWAHDHAYSFSLPWSSYWPQFYALAFIMRVVAF